MNRDRMVYELVSLLPEADDDAIQIAHDLLEDFVASKKNLSKQKNLLYVEEDPFWKTTTVSFYKPSLEKISEHDKKIWGELSEDEEKIVQECFNNGITHAVVATPTKTEQPLVSYDNPADCLYPNLLPHQEYPK